ncbi:hypothetical protein [Rhizobium sp. 18065]|uniref:hypothetical protein n=1 Tax=Rhizobium sp. 18065 TaxID=2681411 RepID=UPI0013583854|nr:hypothetical protein [Rhizobium sp. 18065]
MRLIFRVLSFLALCLGVIAGSVDSIASVSASQISLTPVEAAWMDLSPSSLSALQGLTESQLGAAAWTAFAGLVLPQPAFAALLVLSLLFWMIGYKKPSPAGRFAA